MLKFEGIKARYKKHPNARVITFNRHVNPKNESDYFYRDINDQYNGKAFSWHELCLKFDILSGKEEHNQFINQLANKAKK